MPSPVDILQGLTAIANENLSLAIGWHVALAFGLAALLAEWRPRQRIAALILTLPLLSVGTLAWLYGNPFNGTVFTLLAVALAVLGVRLPNQHLTAAPAWANWAGAMMVGFGWVYPHFLAGHPVTTYLYAAPTGLVPCPTLSVVIGLALLANGFGSRMWSTVLGAAGLFYGLFGTLRLGVHLDWVLVLGAAALLVDAYTAHAAAPRWTARHA